MSLVLTGFHSHELCWLKVGFQETCIFWEGSVIVCRWLAPHFISRREPFQVVTFYVKYLASLWDGLVAGLACWLYCAHGKALITESSSRLVHLYPIHCCYSAPLPSKLSYPLYCRSPVISVILTGRVASWLLCRMCSSMYHSINLNNHEAEAGGSQNLRLAWFT